MKIYFIRNTHDENRNYRGEEYFGMVSFTNLHKTKPVAPEEEWEKARKHNQEFQDHELPFGVHTWYGSGEKYKLTFDEIYRRTIEEYKGGACDGSMEMPNDEEHTVEAFLKALAFMVEKKLVVVQIVDDGVDSPKFVV